MYAINVVRTFFVFIPVVKKMTYDRAIKLLISLSLLNRKINLILYHDVAALCTTVIKYICKLAVD